MSADKGLLERREEEDLMEALAKTKEVEGPMSDAACDAHIGYKKEADREGVRVWPLPTRGHCTRHSCESSPRLRVQRGSAAVSPVSSHPFGGRSHAHAPRRCIFIYTYFIYTFVGWSLRRSGLSGYFVRLKLRNGSDETLKPLRQFETKTLFCSPINSNFNNSRFFSLFFFISFFLFI